MKGKMRFLELNKMFQDFGTSQLHRKVFVEGIFLRSFPLSLLSFDCTPIESSFPDMNFLLFPFYFVIKRTKKE